MSVAKRITFNAVATYVRMILSAGLTIFSSRWVLQALGVSDFGLFSLVGSIIIFITFFNAIMSTSASRHFSYEIGRDVKSETNKWFNTALSIHILLPVVLIIIGYPLGLYFIKNVFVIPIEKVYDSIIVFRLSLMAAFISMLSVPFIAMYIAKQKFIELAVIGFLQSVLTFFAAFLLLRIPGNKLIIYTILIVSIQVLVFIFQIFRATSTFPECKINFSHWFNKRRLIELISFAFWNLIGNFGHLMRSQGLAFLTNIFFGTRGNATVGISEQLSTQTSNLTNALSTSLTPEIIQSLGRGETQRAIKISFQGTKLGIYLILLLTIPLLTETNYVLNLWLTIVPENTDVLCQLMIAVFMIEKTTMSHIALLQGINKIAKPQLSLGFIFTLTIAIAYVMIKIGIGIISIGWSVIISMTISRFILAFWVKKYLNVSLRIWIKEIIIPYLIIVFVGLVLSYFLTTLISASFLRLLLNITINLMVISALSWVILFSRKERSFLQEKAIKILKYK